MRFSITIIWAAFWGVWVEGTWVSKHLEPSQLRSEMSTIPEDPKPGDRRTYVKTVKVSENIDVTMDHLYRVASEHHNWLVSTQDDGHIETDFGSLMVSALWIPEDRMIYVANKANGILHKLMRDEQKTINAPLWASRTAWQGSNSLIPNSIYHAEDTAYYLFEWERSKNNNPLAQTAYENGKPTGLDTEGRQINTLKYPEGAMVATWGYYSWWKTSEKIRGEPIVSCSDGNKYLRGRKGCQTVANDLGVEWARISDLSAEDIAESNELALAAADEEDLDICLDLAASPPSKRNLSNMKKRWVRWAAEAPLARAEGCATTYTVNGDPLVPSTMTKTPLPAETQDGGEPEAPPTTQEPPEPTKPPEKPDCWMQNALPDQYTSAFCRCTQSGETKTLPLLTVESPQVDTQSCDYTAMPTKTENPVTEVTVTFTAGCNVCAGPGGIQNHDPEWCTPIPGCQPPRPTYALYLSDTAALLGTALNEDEGVGLSGSLIDKVKEHCPDDSDICDNEKFDVFDVPIIAGEGVEAMILEATIDDSYYNNTDSRDYMLYSAAAGLVNAALKTCSDVSYQDAADLGESGCGEGPIEKRHPRLPASLLDRDPDATDSSSLEQRIPPTDPDGTDPIMCSYATKMCTGPKVITAILGTQEDPFLNNLGLSFTLRKAHDGFDNPVAEFFCEAIVNGLALLAMRYMPKLPGFEAVSELEDLALEMVCGSE